MDSLHEGRWSLGFFALSKRLEFLKTMVCHCPGSVTTLRGCLLWF